MKQIIIILLICVVGKISAQKYIMLDSLALKFKVNEFTLKTGSLYGVDKEINIYNVYFSPNNILLFSVLPSYQDGKKIPLNTIMYNKPENAFGTVIKEPKINDAWDRINISDIKENIISVSTIENDIISEWGINITPENKTFQYQLVKNIDGNYYVSKKCLVEFFLINNSQYPIIAPYGTINTNEPKVSIKQMQESFKKQYPKDAFPLDIWEKSQSRGGDGVYTVRNYLSREYKIKNDNAYQFWTLDSWWSMHGDNHHRGIDRFVYIPEKGIVGGSYDFYFRDPRGFRIADTVLWQNIINEKVMIAKELK